MSFRIIAGLGLCLGLGLGLAACGNSGIGTANSNSPVGAPSGITANNGGGQRQLGDELNVGVTHGTTTVGNAPNAKGNAY